MNSSPNDAIVPIETVLIHLLSDPICKQDIDIHEEEDEEDDG
jgi:hypothetical protein